MRLSAVGGSSFVIGSIRRQHSSSGSVISSAVSSLWSVIIRRQRSLSAVVLKKRLSRRPRYSLFLEAEYLGTRRRRNSGEKIRSGCCQRARGSIRRQFPPCRRDRPGCRGAPLSIVPRSIFIPANRVSRKRALRGKRGETLALARHREQSQRL